MNVYELHFTNKVKTSLRKTFRFHKGLQLIKYLPMCGISRVISFSSAKDVIFCQNVENSMSERNFSILCILPLIMLFAFPKVAFLDCNVTLIILIIPRMSFNRVTPIKKAQFCI